MSPREVVRSSVQRSRGGSLNAGGAGAWSAATSSPSAQSVFDRQVRRALYILEGCLMALALVPTGLVLFGTISALGSLGWAANTVTIPTTMWAPLFALYLCIAFTTTLRHGARLTSELDQVI